MRRAAFQPATLNPDARTIELTWSTGSRGRRASWFDGDWYEELDMSSDSVRLDRLNNGAALLNNHQSNDLTNILGVVERAWIENGEGRARVRFSERPEVEPIFRDVSSGIIRNVSVGYQVHKWSDPIRGADKEPPTYRALDWEPMELSLVSVPFDSKAQTRSHPASPPMTDENKAGGDPAPIDLDRSAEPPAAAPAAADTELQRTASELRRERDLLRVGQDAGLTTEQTEELIRSGKTVMECSREAMRLMRIRLENGDVRAQGGPAPLGHPAGMSVTHDAGDKLDRSLEAYMAHRSGLDATLDDSAKQFRGDRMVDVVRHFLQSRGINTRGESVNTICDRAFHSTSDFPLLLANVAGKSLNAAYKEEMQSWRPLARQKNLPDFKPMSETQIQGAVTLLPTGENGEYENSTFVEAAANWNLVTYARRLPIGRQLIINDDLGALNDAPAKLGRGARLTENNLVWALLTAGTNGSVTTIDNQAAFVAGHNNTGTGAIGIAGINAGVTALSKQTDIAGNFLNLPAKFLIVPPELRTSALQFVFPTQYAAPALVGATGSNPYAGGMEIIVEPRLSARSATQYYIASDPGLMDMIRFGYLDGQEGPEITSIEKRNPDGVELLVREDFGCTLLDFRGFYRSTGV
jgi:hypothetical protein